MAEAEPKLQVTSSDDIELSGSLSEVEETAKVPSEPVPPRDAIEEDIQHEGAKGRSVSISTELQMPGNQKGVKSIEKDLKSSKCFEVWEVGLTDYCSSEDEADSDSEFDSGVKVSPDSVGSDPITEYLRDAIYTSNELASTVEVVQKCFDDLEDPDRNPEDEVKMQEDFKNMCTNLRQIIDEHLEDAYELVDPEAAYSPQDAEMATMGARFDPTTAVISPSPKRNTRGTEFPPGSARFEPTASTSPQTSFERDPKEAELAAKLGIPRSSVRRPTSLALDLRATSIPSLSAGLDTFPVASRSTNVRLDSRATSLPSMTAGHTVGADSRSTSLRLVADNLRGTDLPSTRAGHHTSASTSRPTSSEGDTSFERDKRDDEFVAVVNKFVPRASARRPTSLSLDIRASDFSFMSAGLHTVGADNSQTSGGGDPRADESTGTRFAEMSRSRFAEHRYHRADISEWGAAKKKKRDRRTPEKKKKSGEGKPKETEDEPGSSLKEKSGTRSEPSGSMGEPSSSMGEPSSSMGEPSSSMGEPSSSMGEPSSSMGEPSSSMGEPSSSMGESSSSMGEPSSSQSEPRSTEQESPKIRISNIFKGFSKIYKKVPGAFERVSRAIDHVPQHISGALGRIYSRSRAPSGVADSGDVLLDPKTAPGGLEPAVSLPESAIPYLEATGQIPEIVLARRDSQTLNEPATDLEDLSTLLSEFRSCLLDPKAADPRARFAAQKDTVADPRSLPTLDSSQPAPGTFTLSPDASILAPGASTSTPGTSAPDPDASISTPGTSAPDPDASTSTPGTSAPDPDASTSTPGTSAPDPDASTSAPDPDASTSTPGTSAPDPDASTSAPEPDSADTSVEGPEFDFPRPTIYDLWIPDDDHFHPRKDPKADVFHSRSGEYYSVASDIFPRNFDRHVCQSENKKSKHSKKQSKKQSPDQKSSDVYARQPGDLLKGTDRNPLGHGDYPTEHDSFVRCFECFIGGLKGPTRADYGKKEEVDERDVYESRQKVEVFRCLIRPIMAKLSMNIPVDPNIHVLDPNIPKPGTHAPWSSMDEFREIIKPLATEHGIKVRTPAYDPMEAESEQKRLEWHPTTPEKDLQRGIKDDSKVKTDESPRKVKEMSDFKKTKEAEQIMEEIDPIGRHATTRRPKAEGKGLLTFREVIRCILSKRDVGISPEQIRDSLCREAVEKHYEAYDKENVDKVDKTIKAGCKLAKRYNRFLRFMKVSCDLIQGKAASKDYRSSIRRNEEETKKLLEAEKVLEADKLCVGEKLADWNMWFNELLNYCVICVIIGRKTLLSYWESMEAFNEAKFEWRRLRHHFLYDERNLYEVETSKK